MREIEKLCSEWKLDIRCRRHKTGEWDAGITHSFISQPLVSERGHVSVEAAMDALEARISSLLGQRAHIEKKNAERQKVWDRPDHGADPDYAETYF